MGTADLIFVSWIVICVIGLLISIQFGGDECMTQKCFGYSFNKHYTDIYYNLSYNYKEFLKLRDKPSEILSTMNYMNKMEILTEDGYKSIEIKNKKDYEEACVELNYLIKNGKHLVSYLSTERFVEVLIVRNKCYAVGPRESLNTLVYLRSPSWYDSKTEYNIEKLLAYAKKTKTKITFNNIKKVSLETTEEKEYNVWID